MLDAAYQILIAGGLRAFSVDAVAARSGVAKTTIYRSWPTRGLLAFASYLDAFETQLIFEQTGAPELNFRALVGSLASALRGPAGRLAVSVLAEAQSDPEVQTQFAEQFSEPLRRQSTKVIETGIETGRFRRDLNIPKLLDAFVGAIYLRLLLGLSLDDAWADGLSDTLLSGCLARQD